ncbi:hypothetical protein CFC21_042408 [Triticum aestivum]|uniref:Uncharacterized protein n=2 Tax=Triticum aestivum TaxID=4565 RepID=A0A9R1FKX5_WHEAT|nr:hypothetical protein CFC21_042408 [Triticum aestivum]
MPIVKPPEWDGMSAKEQLLWYLERLCAQADEMSSVLGIASAGAPPVVTPLDPAASTTTHPSSAPVPDVSGSTTKAQEVLEVIHDAAPVCVVMAPVTCSTDGPNQAVASTNVNEVRDATTITYSEPAVDNKEVEHVTPALATSSISSDTYSITKEVVPSMAITTDIDPKADVNTTPVTSEVDHNAILLIPSDPAAPTLTRWCSTNSCRRDSNRLRYVLHPAATPSWLVLRPKAWPSFWRDHAEETEVRPIPWPSFSLGRFLERPYMNVQLHGIGFNISSIPRELFHIGELVCDTWEWWYNLSGHYIRIFSGLSLCLWPLKQDNEDSEFSKHVKLFHGSHWLVELCARASTSAPVMHQSCLATLAVHLFWTEEIGCSEHRTRHQH